MLIQARAKAVERVKNKILPVLRRQGNRLERFLRRATLRKRLAKITLPAGQFDNASRQDVALYKVQELLKQDRRSDQDEWDRWKKAFLLALLLGLADSADDLASVENEIWTSRGYQPLTYDGEQIIDDYQMRIGRNLSDIGDSTLVAIQNIIGDWYMTDDPFSVLTDRLDALFSESRAEAIAATEVQNLSSQIVFQAMLSHGWSWWYWDAMGENPCSSPIVINGVEYEGCRDLNGRRFRLGTPMPPDAAHPNCVLPGNRVIIPDLVAAAKSFYIGRCIEITLANGSRLTVSENHPILTPNGWMQAKFLHQFDNVIIACDGQRMAACINPNYQDRPTLIEEIFDSLMKSNFMTARSMPISPEDFHGDGRGIYGEIEVVGMDGFLKSHSNTPASQSFGQTDFNGDCIQKQFFTGQSALDAFRDALSAAPDRVMGGAGIGRSLDRCESSMSDRLSRAVTSRFNSMFYQNPSYHAAADAMLLGKFLFRYAGLIESEQIVNIRDFRYSGHVYDLQSAKYGLYICNGIITHNCQCLPTPDTSD